MKSQRINWKEIAETSYTEAEKYYRQYNTPLTLRGLFYILVSKDIIPNTKTAYKTLSSVLSKKRYTGEFPWYLIADVTRKANYLEKWEETPIQLTEEELRQKIKEIIETSVEYSINAWEDQPHRIIITLEKEALYNAIETFISEWEWGVYSLRCTKGFNSATDMNKIATMINTIYLSNQTPVILVISDFDPSGEEIYRDIKRRINLLTDTNNIIIEKILVTKEQIQKYNLPYTPESMDEIKKLQRDPRFKKFHNTHGLMRVEIDAIVSLYPEETKKIIINSIKKYFDQEIYETITLKRLKEKQRTAEEIKKRNQELLKKLLGDRNE